MMYNNIESIIINNGNTGGYFKVERGVRQCCPLSAYLFILTIVIYTSSMIETPTEALKEINDIIQNCIWE